MRKNKLISFGDKLSGGLEALGGVMILVMSLAVCGAVFMRVFFKLSLDMAEESSRYLNVGIVMLLIGVVTYRGEQIVMDLVFNKIKGKAQLYLKLFNETIVALFCGVSTKWGIDWVISQIAYGGKTSSKFFYTWQPALLVPLGFFFAVVLSAITMYKTVLSIKDYKEKPEENGQEPLQEEGQK